jgi:hypothetical protein
VEAVRRVLVVRVSLAQALTIDATPALLASRSS